MVVFVTTALGRMVPAGHPSTVDLDLVLKVLYDYRMNPFNPHNARMSLANLSYASGLSTDLASAMADRLVQEGYVEGDGAKGYSVTGNGLIFVRNLPQGSPGMGSLLGAGD